MPDPSSKPPIGGRLVFHREGLPAIDATPGGCSVSFVESRLPEELMEDMPRGRSDTGTPPADALSGLAREMHEAFSLTGILAKSPDFEYREEQQRMAVEVPSNL